MILALAASRDRQWNGFRSVDKHRLLGSGSILLSEYAAKVVDTDVLDRTDIKPILLGLFGEVGCIMSTAKKHVREGAADPGVKKVAAEEFGDTLWYLAALCRRINIKLDDLFASAAGGDDFKLVGAASDMIDGALAHVLVPTSTISIDATLFELGHAAAALLRDVPDNADIVRFARVYLNALHAAKLTFAEVARGNVQKAQGAFIVPRLEDQENFDSQFGIEEQLPSQFRIRITQRSSGRCYLQWKGVFIGDPLTDNIADPDGYRFHYVFHLAFAAIFQLVASHSSPHQT